MAFFSVIVFIGKYQYSHKFMLHLRYCPTACVRPKDLKLIPGVTDIKPGGKHTESTT